MFSKVHEIYVPVCVCLPNALCLYLTCTWHTHTHTHFCFVPSIFPMLQYVAFHFFQSLSGPSISSSVNHVACYPSGLKHNAQHTHTHTHTHIFDLTLSLPSLGCCVFSFHFSSSLTFLSSVGVCACFSPLFSVSPPLSHMGRTLSTLSCADLYDSSIIVLRTCWGWIQSLALCENLGVRTLVRTFSTWFSANQKADLVGRLTSGWLDWWYR